MLLCPGDVDHGEDRECPIGFDCPLKGPEERCSVAESREGTWRAARLRLPDPPRACRPQRSHGAPRSRRLAAFRGRNTRELAPARAAAAWPRRERRRLHRLPLLGSGRPGPAATAPCRRDLGRLGMLGAMSGPCRRGNRKRRGGDEAVPDPRRAGGARARPCRPPDRRPALPGDARAHPCPAVLTRPRAPSPLVAHPPAALRARLPLWALVGRRPSR